MCMQQNIIIIALILLSVLTRFYLGRYDGKTGIWRFPEIMGRSEKLRGKKMNSLYEHVLGLGPYAMLPGTCRMQWMFVAIISTNSNYWHFIVISIQAWIIVLIDVLDPSAAVYIFLLFNYR